MCQETRVRFCLALLCAGLLDEMVDLYATEYSGIVLSEGRTVSAAAMWGMDKSRSRLSALAGTEEMHEMHFLSGVFSNWCCCCTV